MSRRSSLFASSTIAWGPRKIRAYLLREGVKGVPCPSTITQVLKRHELIDPEESAKHTAFTSLEMDKPNQLWQMDFKGQFRLASGSYCFPLTVLDDHSRFVIGLHACANQTRETVRAVLTNIFRQYGMPDRMLMDNGSPWGYCEKHRYTVLTAWLIRLGIHISHGRSCHPQTQGKVERFHRTLKDELIDQQAFATIADCQQGLDTWLSMYNAQRPHEALGLEVPADHYERSSKDFPETLPPVVYATGDIRKVDAKGRISYKNKLYRISKAFSGQYVSVQLSDDGKYQVFYCHECIDTLDSSYL